MTGILSGDFTGQPYTNLASGLTLSLRFLPSLRPTVKEKTNRTAGCESLIITHLPELFLKGIFPPEKIQTIICQPFFHLTYAHCHTRMTRPMFYSALPLRFGFPPDA